MAVGGQILDGDRDDSFTQREFFHCWMGRSFNSPRAVLASA